MTTGQKTHRMSTLFIFVGTLIAILCASGSYWYYTQPRMYDFDYKRDSAFILDMFQKNWYWLIAEGSDFSPEYFLLNRASSKQPQHLGNETIKVLYKGGTPVGFTSYYKVKFYKGKVHFVLVNEQFRSQGYGLQLVTYAINALVAQGCTEITLVTRENNFSAQKIYKRAGFEEYGCEDGFIYFKYTVK
ncbi:MAG: GNAT family N-acetyltransferase [Candidatus Babeliales bacterium]